MKTSLSGIRRVSWLLLVVLVSAYSIASDAMISTERSMRPYPRKKEIPVFGWANVAPPYLEHAYFEGHDMRPFQADAASFSLSNAWWLAEASTLAYADEAFAAEWFKRAGLDEIRFFEKHSTQCFVASNLESGIVVFRGSEVWRRRGKTDIRVVASDFMTNADFWLTDRPNGGKVHRGFKNALDEVWQDLYAYLTPLQRGGRKIWMTGHSLGGALATLAADRYRDVQGVYTYGSPRVGNIRFKESYSNRAYRIVNGSDIVTKMPPSGFYAHVGNPKFLDHEGVIRSYPAVATMKSLFSVGEYGEHLSPGNGHPPRTPLFLPDAVIDHVPLLYAILIWNSLVDFPPGDE